jgi:hypothetical protein
MPMLAVLRTLLTFGGSVNKLVQKEDSLGQISGQFTVELIQYGGTIRYSLQPRSGRL